MNYTKFDILIVCNGYSKRLDACLHFWEKSYYSKNNYRIIISTWDKDHKTLDVISKYLDRKILNVIVALNHDSDFHNKGKMIQNAFEIIKDNLYDFVFMSDADMIFHPETLVNMNYITSSSKEIMISSFREDVIENEVEEILLNEKYKFKKNIDWPWSNLSLQIRSPSPFMGWFLSFHSSFLSKINFLINHEGYDVIDWKIYGQLLSIGLKEKILHTMHMPLHMSHGKKGSNWSGITVF